MQDYENLAVWGKAHLLTLDVYRATDNFPSRERFGLTSQLRRACASVPTNIAEGAGRRTKSGNVEFARFLVIAEGSASETRYLIRLCADLGYIDDERHDTLSRQVEEVQKMLAGLRRGLK